MSRVWLQEALATFLQYIAGDKVFPEAMYTEDMFVYWENLHALRARSNRPLVFTGESYKAVPVE